MTYLFAFAFLAFFITFKQLQKDVSFFTSKKVRISITTFVVISLLWRIVVGEVHHYHPMVHIAVAAICIPDFSIVCLSVTSFKKILSDENFKQFRENARLLFFAALGTVLFPEIGLVFYLVAQAAKYQIKRHAPPKFSETDQMLHPNIVLIFFSVICFANFIPQLTGLLLPFVLGTVAAFYTLPGYEKLQYDWQKNNNLFFLKKSADFQLNWKKLPDVLVKKLKPGQPIVFIVELFAVLLLLPTNNIEVITIFLMLFFFFHVSVLMSSGINFWKWKTVLAFCVLLLWSPQFESTSLDAYSVLVAYVSMFIYFVFIHKETPRLGWLDSPISNLFKVEIEIKGEKEMLQINPAWFYPYDVVFSQNRFAYLFPKQKFYVGCLGAIRDLNQYMNLSHISQTAENEQHIKQYVTTLIDQKGVSEQNPNFVNGLLSFILRTLKTEQETTFLDSIIKRICPWLIHIRNGINSPFIAPHPSKIGNKIKFSHERRFWSTKLNKFVIISKNEYTAEVQ